ncbi:MAG: hypothetical protein KIT17_16005 [Rubrivivax sp.]|nr:hypothetical protein [Rubrivivax sp.]
MKAIGGASTTKRRVLVAAGVLGAVVFVGAVAWALLPRADDGVRLHAGAPGFPWARAPMTPPGDATEVAPVVPAEAAASAPGPREPGPISGARRGLAGRPV